MLLNAQSIKNKNTLVMDKVIETKTDICIIREMWLKDSIAITSGLKVVK